MDEETQFIFGYEQSLESLHRNSAAHVPGFWSFLAMTPSRNAPQTGMVGFGHYTIILPGFF